MNTLNHSEINLHITILGWLHLAAGVLFLIMGLFVVVLLPGIGLAIGQAEVVRILGFVGTMIGFMMLAFSLPGFVAGYGLLTHRPWSRLLTIVLAVFNFMNFPLGTLMGMYTIWVLLQESAAGYFKLQVSG
ncbi:MAG: hypothetical protein KDJ65_24130 [Anaerolineae bacterium]|nr:hypothetical protein [Anaerolineae bacterium]